MSLTLQEIASNRNKHQLVIAGAGVGKTHTLIHTLSSRIKEGKIDPFDENQKIVVFTFTNNAADELSVRLSNHLKNEKNITNRLFIGTIHGWCNEYLHDNKYLANTKVIGELEQLQLLQRIYTLIGIDKAYDGKNKFIKIKQFLKDLEIVTCENLPLSDKRIPENVKKVLQSYTHFLESERLVDFGMLIKHGVDTLNKKSSNLK